MGLKIAILGTRGIPNHYGGFEQVAAYLSSALVEKGHNVTVYNSHRHPFKDKEWNGVTIQRCFDPEYLIGTAGQFIYDLNCILDSRKKDFDVLLMLGYTSSSIWRSLYPRSSSLITNMDGMEWKRSKYSRLVKKYILNAERMAINAGGMFVADSPAVKNYLDDKYNINSIYIPYGAVIPENFNDDVLNKIKVVADNYFLVMARLEPENNTEMILDGFNEMNSDRKMVVIGSTDTRYGKYLVRKYIKNEKIIFAGAVYDRTYVNSLIRHCSVYFHGHSVGGTNPSLLEAMACKGFIAAHDNVFNRCVLGDGIYFSSGDDVRSIMEDYPLNRNMAVIENNLKKILEEYNWENVVESYERLFYEAVNSVHSRRSTVHSRLHESMVDSD